jgi:beta-glucosidase
MWDVETHEMTVPAGSYEVLAGASSADIRLAAELSVDGPAPLPRHLNGRVVPAADFDDAGNIVLTDETRESGDAVTPAPVPGTGAASTDSAPGTVTTPAGWLLFRNAALGQAGEATFRVAGGRGVIEVRYGEDLVGVVSVPATGGSYDWTEITAPVTLPGSGPRDLRLVVSGDVRLAWFRLDPSL